MLKNILFKFSKIIDSKNVYYFLMSAKIIKKHFYGEDVL